MQSSSRRFQNFAKCLSCVAGSLSQCSECSVVPFCTGGRWETEGANDKITGRGEGVVKDRLPENYGFSTSAHFWQANQEWPVSFQICWHNLTWRAVWVFRKDKNKRIVCPSCGRKITEDQNFYQHTLCGPICCKYFKWWWIGVNSHAARKCYPVAWLQVLTTVIPPYSNFNDNQVRHLGAVVQIVDTRLSLANQNAASTGGRSMSNTHSASTETASYAGYEMSQHFCTFAFKIVML